MMAALLLASGRAESLERRRDQFGKDFGYYLYPLAADIPGIGQATGAGATILNMFCSDADFTGFKLQGDFDASGYALLDLHLLPRTLVFDVGMFDYRVATVAYDRGIDSKPDEYIYREVEGAWKVGQMTLTFAERMFEIYYRLAAGSGRLLHVLDKEGHPFAAMDRSRFDQGQTTYGLITDITDDRLDPRVGFRLEAARKIPSTTWKHGSEYHVTDYDVTGYIPMREWDTLALNLFLSDAEVTHAGITDYDELRSVAGLGCDQLPPGPDQDSCRATEKTQLSEVLAHNINGTATSLGGTQR